MKNRLPRVVIAALRGGSGKTTLAIGLIAAWRERAGQVVPFKKGRQVRGLEPRGLQPVRRPWDRIAHLFLVLDDCIEAGGSCITPRNLELMRAITPFGTGAPPPNGSGVVPPRLLTLDVTPLAPVLTGRKYVGRRSDTTSSRAGG